MSKRHSPMPFRAAMMQARLGPDLEAQKRQRSVVRAYAKQVGIVPARQKAPRVRNRRPAWARDREANGQCRTLHADEIRALGYATTKAEG